MPLGGELRALQRSEPPFSCFNASRAQLGHTARPRFSGTRPPALHPPPFKCTAGSGPLAHFLSELNVIHAFREGNGRTQLSFFLLLADHAGHPIDLEDLEPDTFWMR
ncbi:Fic family protein [Bradyrhizobium sp. BRP20]|uniref:Fic family protein n=1 Tax=unclassified Bradyrhizobium TaxID=2631580 RepID=UPI00320A4409